MKTFIYETVAPLKRFWRMAYFSYCNNSLWTPPHVFISNKIINPILQILFYVCVFDYIGGQPRSFYLIGNAVQIVCLSSIFGIANCIESDRKEGTFLQILTTPVHWPVFFISRVLVFLVDGLITSIIGLCFVITIYQLKITTTDYVAFGASLLCAIFSSSGLGILVGSLGFYIRDIVVIANIANHLTVIFCGINFPINNLPLALQTISYALPLTRSVEAIRLAVGGHTLVELYPMLMADIWIGLIYTAFGLVISRIAGRLNRKYDHAGIY